MKKQVKYRIAYESRYRKRFKVHCNCTSSFENSRTPEEWRKERNKKPGDMDYFMEGEFNCQCPKCRMFFRFYPKGLGPAKLKKEEEKK